MLTDWAYSATGANSKAAARATEARRAKCCEIGRCESWLMRRFLLEDGTRGGPGRSQIRSVR